MSPSRPSAINFYFGKLSGKQHSGPTEKKTAVATEKKTEVAANN